MKKVWGKRIGEAVFETVTIRRYREVALLFVGGKNTSFWAL